MPPLAHGQRVDKLQKEKRVEKKGKTSAPKPYGRDGNCFFFLFLFFFFFFFFRMKNAGQRNRPMRSSVLYETKRIGELLLTRGAIIGATSKVQLHRGQKGKY